MAKKKEEFVKQDEQLEEVNNVAREEANGDYEIYSSIYNSEISRIEPCEYEEQLFNRSMLVMVVVSYLTLKACRLNR